MCLIRKDGRVGRWEVFLTFFLDTQVFIHRYLISGSELTYLELIYDAFHDSFLAFMEHKDQTCMIWIMECGVSVWSQVWSGLS